MADKLKKRQTSISVEENLFLECKKYCLDKNKNFQDYVSELLLKDKENREKDRN